MGPSSHLQTCGEGEGEGRREGGSEGGRRTCHGGVSKMDTARTQCSEDGRIKSKTAAGAAGEMAGAAGPRVGPGGAGRGEAGRGEGRRGEARGAASRVTRHKQRIDEGGSTITIARHFSRGEGRGGDGTPTPASASASASRAMRCDERPRKPLTTNHHL